MYMPGPNAPLMYSALPTQRRKDQWGEDAWEFVPECWVGLSRTKGLTAGSFRFSPSMLVLMSVVVR